jgi:hypothetical protein
MACALALPAAAQPAADAPSKGATVAPASTSGVSVSVPEAGAELYAPSRACFVKVLEDAATHGLRARLYARDRLVHEVTGAREMAWVDDVLVYAVSPVGGDPGVYVWDCRRSTVRQVLRPSRVSSAHPRGTDVYKLERIDGDTLYYAHAPNVESPSLKQDLEQGIETLRLATPHSMISMR